MRGYGPSGAGVKNGEEMRHTDTRVTGKGCEVLRQQTKPKLTQTSMKRMSRSTGKR